MRIAAQWSDYAFEVKVALTLEQEDVARLPYTVREIVRELNGPGGAAFLSTLLLGRSSLTRPPDRSPTVDPNARLVPAVWSERITTAFRERAALLTAGEFVIDRARAEAAVEAAVGIRGSTPPPPLPPPPKPKPVPGSFPEIDLGPVEDK